MEQESFARQFSPVNYTMNVRGQLFDLSEPCVMGILNVTPDSFYADSRMQTEAEIYKRTNQIIAEGAKIIDVGACSTRPGGEFVDEAEEMRRLTMALPIIRQAQPDAIISIDTFRASIARCMVEEFNADIVNDVEEGGDPDMFRTVAELGTPYILMSKAANIHDMLINLSREVQELHALGQKDIILDPGFGFGKDPIDGNYDSPTIGHHSTGKLERNDSPEYDFTDERCKHFACSRCERSRRDHTDLRTFGSCDKGRIGCPLHKRNSRKEGICFLNLA